MPLTMVATFIVALAILIVWDPLKYRQNRRTPLARSIAWIRARLVDNARDWWRWWSVRFNAVGLAILSWVSFDPVGPLYVWSLMPEPVRDILPRNFALMVGLGLFGLSLLARVVKQKPKNG